MNPTLESIYRSCTNSKSSDKLALVMAGLESIPQPKLEKLESITIDWETKFCNDDDVIVPKVTMTFFQ